MLIIIFVVCLFVLSLCVGGVREALFSDEYYEVLWGQRTGFAKIALEAQVVSTRSVVRYFSCSCTYIVHGSRNTMVVL